MEDKSRSQLRSKTKSPVSIEVGDFQSDTPRPAVILNIDGSEKLGALSYEAGLDIAAAAEMALEKRLPLVSYIFSVGADIEEGVSAVHGWGVAAQKLVECSGIVPNIFTILGPAVSGPALLLGISDISIMTENSYAFVSGPTMVRQFTGVNVSADQLGGFSAHDTKSGVADFVVPDKAAAQNLIAELLTLLPPNTDTLPTRLETDDPTDRTTPEIARIIPDNPQGTYDVRQILRMVVDDGEILELKAKHATNIVTAFATVGGYPVGIVANQPQNLAGTLDISGAQKAARFVNFLDCFNMPILTFVDTPGFQPGKDQEWRGMIRHGAQLAFAYARATVPRICVTLRKSYGGAYIVMDSKKMGNDFSFAWPSAEIAVMGAKGAVEILHRATEASERQKLEESYVQQHLNPYKAAERGSIDAVIDPTTTRQHIAAALELTMTKREEFGNQFGNQFQNGHHDNTPL